MFARLYWILPLFSTLTWLSMLTAMLASWGARGEYEYPSEDRGQTIPYISDVGAYRLRPLFIAMAATTVVTLDLSMLAERWLRHNGRLAPNTSWFQKGLSIAALIVAVAGALGIILLSIYDTAQYPKLHDRFLGVFLAGYVISAILICWEYQRLGIHFKQHAVLRASFWLKLFFILIEIALAIAFGVCEYKKVYNASAILEWILAYVFTCYILTFVLDLLPAVKTKHHMSHPAVAEVHEYAERNAGASGYHSSHHHATNGTPVMNGTNGTAEVYPGPATNY